MKSMNTSFIAQFLLFVLLFAASQYLLSDYMQSYPSTIHAWTQSDRIALAQNFQENGFDLFHPATYNLLTKDGITQVDFPIHDYLVAIISSTFKTKIVSTFRWYTLLYSLIGFLFLFKSILLLRKSYARAYFGTFFIFTLPFLVYYLNGFLPSVPSLSNFFIGLYYLILAQKKEETRSYLIAALFLSLAALSRSPFVIFLFAVILSFIWRQRKLQKTQWRQLWPFALGFVVFLLYWSYNQWLGKSYGSMFLNKSLHFESLNNFIEIIEVAWDRWAGQLFSAYHFFAYIILLFFYFTASRFKQTAGELWPFWKTFILLASLGILIYFLALGQQYAEHDYYYIDSFLPLFVLIFLYVLAKVEIPRKWYTPSFTLLALFSIYFLSSAKEIQNERYTPDFNDRLDYATNIYKQSKKDLINWGIDPLDTLYIIEANSTNIPFTIWGNRGYTNLYTSADTLKKELARPFNYAVLVDSFFRKSTFNAYPDLVRQLEKVHSNGNISIYKKQSNGDPQLFFDRLYHYSVTNFDNQEGLPDSLLKWTERAVISDSIGQSLYLKDKNEFALTVKTILTNFLPNRPIRMHIAGDFYQNDTSKFHIVCSGKGYYKSHYIESHFKKTKEWTQLQFDFNVPAKHFKEEDEIAFYFWNPEKNELFIDNLKLLIYQ